jgi:hypothetical protein
VRPRRWPRPWSPSPPNPRTPRPTWSAIPVFPILFGDSDRGELQHIADLTGGRLFDAQKGSLDGAFEEIRGYQ